MKVDKFKIKKIIAKKQINSQSKLAKELGISKSALKYLAWSFNSIKSHVIKIADFFNVSLNEIIKEKS